MPEAGPARHPWVVRHPAIVLLLAAAVTVIAAVGAARIEPQVDFVDTVPEHDGLGPYRRVLDELDGVRFLAVYMAHDAASGTDSLRGEAFDALVTEQESLTVALQDRFGDDITHTLSVYEAMRTGNYMLAKIATAGNAPDSAYALPGDPVTWQLVKDQALGGDGLDDVLAQDGSSAILLAFLAPTDPADARALAGDVGDFTLAWAETQANHPVTTGHAPSGLLWSSHVTDERNRDETVKWGIVAAAAVSLVLLWVTRSLLDTVVAVTSLAVALTWTYGAMGWSGIPISFLTFVLAPIVMGVGIDYAVHILRRARQEVGRGDGSRPRDAMATALRHTGRAVALAAVTTIVGLGVLAFLPAPLFAQIGLVAAIGIAFGLLAALTIVPAAWSTLPVRAGQDRDAVGPLLARWGRFARRRSWLPTGIVVLAVVGAAIVVATQTRIESGSAENEFPQDDPLITLQHRIEAEYGAFQRGYVVVEGPIARADALAAIHAATASAAAVPSARDATAVTALVLADEATDDGAIDIVDGTVRGTAGMARSDEQRLPQTDAEAAAALERLWADPLWRSLVPFTTTRAADLSVVAITVDPWEDQDALRDLRDALQEQAAALQGALGDEYKVSAAGAPVNRAAIIDQTPWDIGLATIGVTLASGAVLALAWARRGLAGLRAAGLAAGVVAGATLLLLATVPLLDALYRFAAGQGAAANSAALNDMFLVAFALTAAMGVDDVVHLAERAWERRGSRPDSVAAMRGAGRAISGTTLTTFAAFAPLAGVYFLQSKNLAILCAAGVLYAYLVTVALAPRWLTKALPRPPDSTPRGP